jgi:vacuolar protein sorting-associated protein 13A/C
MKMGHASESVRFVDDTDLALTFDSRATSSQQMTNIEIMAKPIVLRASYRDINLIMSITNKAVQRYGDSQRTRTVQENEANSNSDGVNVKKIDIATTQANSSGNRETQYVGNARVLMTKEQVNPSNAF